MFNTRRLVGCDGYRDANIQGRASFIICLMFKAVDTCTRQTGHTFSGLNEEMMLDMYSILIFAVMVIFMESLIIQIGMYVPFRAIFP